MSTGGKKTQRYVNTLTGEGNNQLLLLERGNIIPPIDLPNAPNDCSSDPDNTICGFGAGAGITTATGVTLFGNRAGSKTNINNSLFIGNGAGEFTIAGVNSTAVGINAMANMTKFNNGGNNTAVGANSQQAATDNFNCTSVGSTSLQTLDTGVANVAIGDKAMRNAVTGNNNTACGASSLLNVLNNNSNSAFGNNVLISMTNGDNNTCIGKSSGANLLTGSNNTFLGINSGIALNAGQSDCIMISNDGEVGDSGVLRIGRSGDLTNVFIEGIHSITPAAATQMVVISAAGELGSTTTGGLIGITDTENTALGIGAMTSITSGDSNVIIGFDAANFMSTAGESVVIGAHAAETVLNTGRGIFIGANCGLNTSVTSGTVAMGFNALQNMTSGTGNTVAIGFESLQTNTGGGGNTAVGALTLKQLTTGVTNTAIGRFAGTNIIGGDSNVYIGSSAGLGNGLSSDGDSNTAVGTFSLSSASAGSDNTALGRSAGNGILTGSGNIYIGEASGTAHNAAESNNIIIGDSGIVGDTLTIRLGSTGVHTSCFLAGVASVTPSGTTETVIIDTSTGELGTVSSGTTADATGVIAGGFITINADPTKFDVSDGNGIIYDTVTEVKTIVSWTGLTAQSTTYVGDETFISINTAGSVVFSTTLPTNNQIRDNIYLGQIVHLDQINIITTLDEQMTLLSEANQIRDFMQAVGMLKISGNVLSSNSLLTIAKSAGDILKFGGNFSNDIDNPHLPTSDALDTNVADVFAYRWKDGSNRLMLTSIVPGEFDNGGGEAAPGTVMSNQWSVQRVFTFSIGQMVIQQAQFVYGNEADAVAAIQTEGFIIEADLAVSGVLIGFIALKGNTTDLNSVDATFLEAGKFGGSSVGTASGVNGPGSSTDNAIARWDGTTGTTIQNSSVIIDDSNNVSGIVGLQATGAIDFDTVTTFNVETTAVGSTACEIFVNGDATSELHIENKTGTTNDSVRIDSVLGGIDIDAENDIFIDAATGRIDLRAVGNTGGSSIQLQASAGSIDIDAALNVDIDATNGVMISTMTERIDLHAIGSTAVGAIQLESTLGGINIDSNNDVTIDSTTGRIDLRAVGSTSPTAVQLDASAGGIQILTALDLDINATSDVFIDTTNGRIDLNATGSTDNNAIQLNAVAGGIDIDADLQINVESAQSSAAAIHLDASAVAGGIELTAGTAGIELNSTATGTALGFFTSPIVQVTTGVAESVFVENSGGTVVNVDSTFDGYTLQQVVQALRNYGLLA